MNTSMEQFPYRLKSPAVGEACRLPLIPITFELNGQSVDVLALLDTGSTVNVLPFSIGAKLGADWDRQSTAVSLTGNLANVPARVITVRATVGNFTPVQLAFAWAQAESIPVILGQVNFFMEFDVCFFRLKSVFEVRPASRIQ